MEILIAPSSALLVSRRGMYNSGPRCVKRYVKSGPKSMFSSRRGTDPEPSRDLEGLRRARARNVRGCHPKRVGRVALRRLGLRTASAGRDALGPRSSKSALGMRHTQASGDPRVQGPIRKLAARGQDRVTAASTRDVRDKHGDTDRAYEFNRRHVRVRRGAIFERTDRPARGAKGVVQLAEWPHRHHGSTSTTP